MNDKEYLDRNGLKNYDALIKKYIDKKIAKAIAEYEAKDNSIEDFKGDEPEITEFIPE